MGTKWESPSAITARSYTNGTRTLYNFRAASGGTIGNGYSSGEADGSVCPKGWTLPSGNTNGDYYGLITTTYRLNNDTNGVAKAKQDPLNFNVTKGYSWEDGVLGWPDWGRYWTRTIKDANEAYVLDILNSEISAGTGSNTRGQGFAIRCIAR